MRPGEGHGSLPSNSDSGALLCTPLTRTALWDMGAPRHPASQADILRHRGAKSRLKVSAGAPSSGPQALAIPS